MQHPLLHYINGAFTDQQCCYLTSSFIIRHFTMLQNNNKLILQPLCHDGAA